MMMLNFFFASGSSSSPQSTFFHTCQILIHTISCVAFISLWGVQSPIQIKNMIIAQKQGSHYKGLSHITRHPLQLPLMAFLFILIISYENSLSLSFVSFLIWNMAKHEERFLSMVCDSSSLMMTMKVLTRQINGILENRVSGGLSSPGYAIDCCAPSSWSVILCRFKARIL